MTDLKTLRSLSGLGSEPATLAGSALLLIDLQNTYCDGVMRLANVEPAIAEAKDDPATLRSYLDRFNPEFEGFTGPLEDIVDIANAVHVPIEKGQRLPSGGYEVSHGTAILGVTPDGEVPILWTEGTSAAKLAEDIETILSDGLPTSDEEASS